MAETLAEETAQSVMIGALTAKAYEEAMMPSASFMNPDLLKTEKEYHYAGYILDQLLEQAHAFDAKLDNEHEVGIKFASFGTPTIMTVTEISYRNPDLLIFSGYIDGKPAELVQHLSQLNFLMVSVPRKNPDRPRTVIKGFRAD